MLAPWYMRLSRRRESADVRSTNALNFEVLDFAASSRSSNASRTSFGVIGSARISGIAYLSRFSV